MLWEEDQLQVGGCGVGSCLARAAREHYGRGTPHFASVTPLYFQSSPKVQVLISSCLRYSIKRS
jgi:hypothetical protein